jgi:hypothetical protein
MSDGQNLPWRQICDYLAEIGIENNITTFCDKSICELNRLIPYDSAILNRLICAGSTLSAFANALFYISK